MTQQTNTNVTEQTEEEPAHSAAELSPPEQGAQAQNQPGSTNSSGEGSGSHSERGSSSASSSKENTRTSGNSDTSPPGQGDVTAESVMSQLRKLPAMELDGLLNALAEEVGEDEDEDDDYDLDEDEFDDDDDEDEEDSARAKGPIRYNQLEPGAQQALSTVHRQMLDQAIDSAIDSDKELGYNLTQLTAKGQSAVRDIVRKEVRTLAEEAGDRFDYDWGRAAKEAVARTRESIEPLFERKSPTVGLGGAPGSFSGDRELPEPKRVPAYADGDSYEQYIADKMRYNQQRIEKEASSGA